jgi:hypothetical protein
MLMTAAEIAAVAVAVLIYVWWWRMTLRFLMSTPSAPSGDEWSLLALFLILATAGCWLLAPVLIVAGIGRRIMLHANFTGGADGLGHWLAGGHKDHR